METMDPFSKNWRYGKTAFSCDTLLQRAGLHQLLMVATTRILCREQLGASNELRLAQLVVEFSAKS